MGRGHSSYGGEKMCEKVKKFALPLVVLGFYQLAKLGELTINVRHMALRILAKRCPRFRILL